MKLLELRSPTTLTPQTPLPLTPSARQFVVPSTKLAPPPTTTATSDAAKDTSATEAVSKDVTSQDGATAVEKATDNSIQDGVKENHVSSDIDASNVLSTVEPEAGAELLPPANNDVTSSTTAAEDLFPIDFPNSDHQAPGNKHIISEGTEEIQQPMEFEASNQISTDMAGSPDPTAFDDFNNMGQFDQSEPLAETNQSDHLAAEQLTQLPQQPVQSDIDAHQLEDTS